MNEENKNALPAEEVADENEIIAIRHQKPHHGTESGEDYEYFGINSHLLRRYTYEYRTKCPLCATTMATIYCIW